MPPALTVAKIHTSGKPPRDFLGGMLVSEKALYKRPKQKLQPGQAYSVLNYRAGKNLKDVIEAEWKLKCDDNPELEHVKGAFLKYRNKRMDQLLEAETPEVKEEVEIFRNKQKESAPASAPFLEPHEVDLPEEDKDRILLYRSIQR